MTKAEILFKLNLKELIGTSFENMITVTEIKKGDSLYYERLKEFNTCYIIEGHIQHIVYTPEGGEFYKDLYKGDITGVNFCFSKGISPERFRHFDVDVLAKIDSKIAYLPLDKIMDLEFKGKNTILKKLIMMGVEDHFKEFKYLFLKNIYSDELFFIKHLEKCKIINIGNTKKNSEHLNIKLRTLQRFLKNLQDQDITERIGDKISIKDYLKLETYKKKFEK